MSKKTEYIDENKSWNIKPYQRSDTWKIKRKKLKIKVEMLKQTGNTNKMWGDN